MTAGDAAGGEGALGGALRARLGGRSMLGPGGEPGVAHQLRPRRRAGPAVARALCIVVAIGSAAAGAFLALSPATVPVRVTGSAFQVGDASMHVVASGEFQGDGALVIRAQADGTVVAAGDAVVGGVRVSGECLEDADRRTERCVFDVGGRGLGAVDTWTSSGWHRHYDDGQVVEIASSSPVPVPFLVGR
jgi:hypothetical protein